MHVHREEWKALHRQTQKEEQIDAHSSVFAYAHALVFHTHANTDAMIPKTAYGGTEGDIGSHQ